MNKYYNYPSLEYWGDGKDLGASFSFNEEKLKLSESGKFLADSRSARYLYTGFTDPKYKEYWESMGCIMEIREKEGQKWAFFAPKDVLEDPEKKLPVLMIFRPFDYYAMVFYRTFFEMAAQGEFIAMVYSSESPEVNEVYEKMLDEVIEEFHADPTRVYVTGHSHYGGLAMEFGYRHRQRIAGIAQMADEAGIIRKLNPANADRLEMMHNYDMPLINIGGTTDFCGIYPVNQDINDIPNRERMESHGFLLKRDDRIESWQHRMYAMNCRVPTYEEIANAGKTAAERAFGYPADHMISFYAENVQHYIAQFYNVEGKQHFTTVAIDNFTHATSHIMLELAWSFLRKFARDLDTQAVIETDY